MRGALLVDFDGTLVDSLPGLRVVLDAFLRARGATPAPGEFESLNGPPLRDVVARLASRHRLCEPPATLLADYERRVAAVYAGAPQKQGVSELFTAARDRRMHIGIVTSNHRDNVQRWLDAHRLGAFVDHVTDAQSSSSGKPNPDPYLHALAQLDADVPASVAVEDSATGATAALGAKLRTFVVGSASDAWPSGCEVVSTLVAVAGALERV